MLIDGLRTGRYLRDTGLMMDEFYLLYRVMVQEQNMIDGILKVHPEDKESFIKEFSQLSKLYQDTHTSYLGIDIDWMKVMHKLEDNEFLEIKVKLKDRVGLTAYKLTDLKVTDKFKGYFLISDIERAFYEFMDLFPRWVIVKGATYPSNDRTTEELIELYNQHILKGGNDLLHQRCMMLTARWLKKQSSKHAPMGMYKFITQAYDGIARNIEEEAQTSSGLDYNEI